MGDTAVVTAGQAAPGPAVDPAAILRAQVNRFWDSGAPEAYRFGPDTDKVPPTGPIDMATAIRAVLIVQKRANEAYSSDPDAGADLLNKANAGFADPVGWVNKNLEMVTQTVTIYGDIHGIPKATMPGQILGALSNLSATTMIGIIGAIVVGAYLITRRR